MAIQVFTSNCKYVSATEIDVTKMNDNAPINNGDLIIVIGWRASSTIPDLVTSGYNSLFGGTVYRTPNGKNVSIRMWWKIKQELDTTISHSNLSGSSPSGQYLGYVVRGVDQANPFDITPNATNHVISGGNGSAFNPPAMTPVTPGAAVLYWAHDWSSSGTSTLSWNSPAAQGNMINSGINTPKLYHRFGYFTNWSSGAVDGTLSGGFKDGWIIPALAIKPATDVGRVKVWDGSAHVAKPVKYWNGSAWVTKPVKIWDGSAWVTTSY